MIRLLKILQIPQQIFRLNYDNYAQIITTIGGIVRLSL